MRGFTGKRVGTSFPISDEECKQIHASAVRVLEKGGMRCDDVRASKLSEKAGCKLENNGKLVKIPEKVINQALDKCPDQFIIYGREPKNDVVIGNGEIHFATLDKPFSKELCLDGTSWKTWGIQSDPYGIWNHRFSIGTPPHNICCQRGNGSYDASFYDNGTF